MHRRGSVSETDVVSFIIRKSKEAEATNPYDARSWLLTGKSVAAHNFSLQTEAYLLEKRLGNVEGAARCFENLFQLFGRRLIEEINEIASAIRVCTLSKGKETREQSFLQEMFLAFSKETQMEVLIHSSHHTSVLYEKCQCMLVLVKLHPEVMRQQNGAELILTLLACESDAYSTFRKLLVTELVPSLLELSQDLKAAPRFETLLDQCIEYYVLVGATEGKDDSDEDERWDKLYTIVDQIGSVLQWPSAPFFRNVRTNQGTTGVEALFHAINKAFQSRHHYSSTELAYIFLVVFLRSIVSYASLRNGRTLGDKSKMTLVEIFLPQSPNHRGAPVDPNLPILMTASQCISVGDLHSQLLQNFQTAVKIWELILSRKEDAVGKEFFRILYSMKDLKLDHWQVFKDFTLDYRTYRGHHVSQDTMQVQNCLKLASMYCSSNNFKVAAELAIKAVCDVVQQDSGGASPSTSRPSECGVNSVPNFKSKEDFSFYSRHIYELDGKGSYIYQRRVHFLSENRSEIVAYAANVLIKCFHELLEVALVSKDDRAMGHLMTLLQLEWPSEPADFMLAHIIQRIRQNESFRYFPWFADFVIEPEFLELFMAVATHEPNVQLDIFPPTSSSAQTGSRRMGTRGLEKGSKTEFKTAMQRQMMKNGQENLETLIIKFLTLNKVDILTCFECS